ncbi:MAG TPA: glycosyltransferase, partial [Polyangiales bacterium]|nr:glycosyltransferase [Polyangiales bacterium]
TLPIPGFPYGGLARLPEKRREGAYVVHRPHYLYLVPKRWLYPVAGPAMARSLARYAAELERPDIIHAHWSYPDGQAALALRRHFDVPLVVHARGTLERVIARQSRRFRALVATPLMAADAVIANSEALRLDCLELGVAAEKLHVIPNGVDLELFKPSDKRAAKRALGLAEDRLLALYCGNLRPVKGVDLLAAAIPPLRAARPNLHFGLVGGGELEASLRRQLAKFIEDRSVRMTGALPPAEVARYMSAADLLILPSRSEARSNVIIEALACETPVAAARVGGIPEVMRDDHGVLFAPERTDAIVEALSQLTADPSHLPRLGAAGRRFVLEGDMTWDAHARRTVELYAQLIGRA